MREGVRRGVRGKGEGWEEQGGRSGGGQKGEGGVESSGRTYSHSYSQVHCNREYKEKTKPHTEAQAMAGLPHSSCPPCCTSL